ncbi:TlpA disulfide reductase family protein [Algoriphagus sp. D3-2-R+10]|uniref:TlpA family protein disulfide reductase n=1 Tax=Algoriphagus aurantiacus TaxID=3103948 RepID=UPI002B3FF3E8|nr:TlpA disulfide reductase family protein [Algoriphagus sp. D3-2-R+10]MEB2778364.1 TlpA disulfide reductase family protein [Algoriphagus sp. D3-2-R+10]
MKIIKDILIIVTFFIVVSCKQETQYSEKKPIVVTGKIHKYNGKNAALSFVYSQPGVNESTELVEIDSAGNFGYTIEGYIPLDAMLLEQTTFANIYFIYHPGDSIHIEFEANNKSIELTKTIKYSGSRATTNNQIINFQVLREENNLGYGAIDEAKSYQKDLADFILEMNAVKEKQLNIYNSFIEEYSPSEEVKSWTRLFALETYYYFLDKYSWENTNLPDNYFDYNREILPITMDKLIGWHVLEKRITSYLQTNLFPKFAKQYPDIDLIQSLTDKTSKSDSLFIEFVRDNYTDDLLGQLTYSGLYKSLFSMNSLESYQRNQVAIKEELSAPFILNPLQESYHKTQEIINSPEEKTAVILKKMVGSPIEETFNKILDTNKGKVIYLDFWATWCKPCIEEMPSSNLLMSKLEQQGVAFVYVSIDENEEKRKKLLSEFDIDRGQHYPLDSKQVQALFDVFQFNGIPYYILIDKNGQIMERGNQLSPSMKSTEEKITDLLNEI